jgi:hypothetical protein
MKERHDELAEFLQTHQSPYTQPDLSHYPPRQRSARVDPSKSLYDLWVRCPYCREIIEAHFGEAIL